MDHPSQVAVGQSRVVVLDTGNGKVLTFDQIEGTLLQEVNVAQPYRDLTLLGDSLIALVPGRGQKAFDLLSFGGKLLGSYGDGSQLPRSCAACQIVYLSVGLLAVIDSERPIIRFLGLDGERYNIVDFEHVEDLRKWRGEFRELIRNRSNAPAGKVWVADAVAVGEGRIALAVTPERVHERPRELWLVDAKEGLTARFRYDRVQVGYAISSFPDVFTIGLRDGAIYVFGPSSNWR